MSLFRECALNVDRDYIPCLECNHRSHWSHASYGASMTMLSVNGESRHVSVPDDMPLSWVLRDVLGMTGTKFGCGIGLCGACTVHLDGQAIRSCMTSVAAAAGRRITTIEAVGDTTAGKAIQQAWIALDVPQCGYCQSGQV